ncbi:MAG TPA: D-alanyl-D-alanine carboxypeptidase/D-alanyl-D-alanine-endopeptidase [Pyrinomonadaceae bacterium]|nr:D-alanyl-D-alanine carboxypeptidase/D-alanyl-D-alanine-endopeptidase [Pyrinomonadaceae bacterium]
MNKQGRIFNQRYSQLFTLIFIFGLLFFLSSCLQQPQPENQAELSEETNSDTAEIPVSSIDLAKPLEISEKPEDKQLCEKVNQIIENSQFANARWGVIAVSLKDGRVACGRDARKLFTPASVQKVLTSIVALDKLGANFRWKTTVYSQNQIREDGVLEGDLILYGQGAPDFDTSGVEQLINQLKSKGLKSVSGNIVGDASYFLGDSLGDGWTWNDLQWYYGAEASALTINENQTSIYTENGQTVASTDFVEISTNVSPPKEMEAIGIKRELGANKFYVWGEGRHVAGRVSVEKPELWAAKILKKKLEENGITVSGEAQARDWKSENKLNAETAVELASVESRTLGEIVRMMNKKSVNLYAELLLRTLGRKFGNEAPDTNAKKQKLRGDDTAGASLVKKWLKEKNVAVQEIEIHDASGLSRLNFITPEALGRALVYAAQANFADTFKDSLPIAATDGTLGGRLGKVRGRVLAKTGSITYVNSLAGYAGTKGEDTFAFAVLVNNDTRAGDSSRVIDEIVTAMAEF